MAQRKETVEEAFAGDIIGLPDTGNFRIGDTITAGEELHFKGLPSFSPELFKYIENQDPMKTKQLAKGIDQLMGEGVAQLFVNQFNGRKIIGTVGQLQFESSSTAYSTSMAPPVAGSLSASIRHAGSKAMIPQSSRTSRSVSLSSGEGPCWS